MRCTIVKYKDGASYIVYWRSVLNWLFDYHAYSAVTTSCVEIPPGIFWTEPIHPSNFPPVPTFGVFISIKESPGASISTRKRPVDTLAQIVQALKEEESL
jgi:hypothetical protein